MSAKVISFINMKGGVGKTTLAVNVGYTLSKHFNKKVILIDVDPQMNATQYTLTAEQVKEIIENPKNTLYGILQDKLELAPITEKNPQQNDQKYIYEISNNFDIIPSHLNIMNINLDNSPFRLLNYIKEVLKHEYDVIIIDSPPTISSYTKISLLASDMYLVPMKTDYLSLFGLPLLENYIDLLKREFSLTLDLLGITLTMVNPEFSIYTNVKKRLHQKREWSSKIFDTELPNKTIVAKALSPENENSKFIYDLKGDGADLKDKIVGISQEFIQKGRI
ncbi:ParA family protein [Peribacillus frigoritolerans]|uniref:ParA family protein n=1 Tax=Peribacillus frigoritolerans TaxID=450367 RepID=UPI003449B69D